MSQPALAPNAPGAIAEKPASIAVDGFGPVEVRIYGRKRPGAAAPLVLHFHGGTFVSGGLDNGAWMARMLAQLGAVVVSVAYPLAPAHPFPQAVEAGYAALAWTYKQRTRLAGAGAKVYLAGEEAGGNLAAAVGMVARDRGHPPLDGQVLVAPMLDPCVGTASLRQRQASDTVCKWADGWQQYLRSPRDAEHPYAVPAHATRLAGLPPALVLTGQDDPMRDEALAYAQRLRDAGIPVTTGVLGTTTGWPDALAEVPPPPCPCEAAVKRHLHAFLYPATPPPS
ncbi:MAG TPA: alpha/beta hydrolase [Ramlibacter sp.]|jgi:acetyl esterase/lipase|uniref:alpha/beta hydrolase n=1 Tax=Ramlibacter sp. TaxID=1917967 RepID=UPI002D5DADB0|nr:alpha/beta hydrolase [Ramlibacter sp.]HZY19050.1 alpha/beta hydrolase [Ramlibacter sp.]